jgi:hypothetical protein
MNPHTMKITFRFLLLEWNVLEVTGSNNSIVDCATWTDFLEADHLEMGEEVSAGH